MSFSESAGVITQTGTDVGLANLDGTTGVTTYTFTELTIYDCGTAKLVIEGTLTINGSDEGAREMLVIGINGATQEVDISISSSGTLTIGRLASQSGATFATDRHWCSIYEDAAVDFDDGNGDIDNDGGTSDCFLNVEGGGTLNWYGCINSCGGMRFKGVKDDVSGSESNINIVGGVLDVRRVTEASGETSDTAIYTYTDNLDITPPTDSDAGFTILTSERTGSNPSLRTGCVIVQVGEPTNIKGFECVFSSSAFMGSKISTIDLSFTIEDYSGVIGDTSRNLDLESQTDSGSNTSIITFLNSRLGSTLQIETTEFDNGFNTIRAEQTVSGTSKTLAGANRVDAVVGTVSQNGTVTADLVPAGVFDLGAILLATWDGEDPIGVVFNNPNDSNDDLWSICNYSYLGLAECRVNVRLRGEGGTGIDFNTDDDDSVTQIVRATVDAYSKISNLDRLYDRSKSFKVATANINKPTLLSPIVKTAGSAVDIGDIDLIIHGDVVSAYDYDDFPTPHEITIYTGESLSIIRVGETEAIVDAIEDDEITVAFPFGIADDDVAYLIIGHPESDDNAWDTPNGWVIVAGLTEVQTGGTPDSVPGVSVFRRILDGDSGDVTVENSGSNISGIVGQMIVYRNVDQTTPEDVTPTIASGSSGDPDPASITPVNNSSMILAIGFADAEQTQTAVPAGYTAIHDTMTASGGDEGLDAGTPGEEAFAVTGTFVIPDDVTEIEVKCWGGGGGGGGAGGSGTSKAGVGGGGGFAHVTAVSVTPGEILDIIVGTGGEGGESAATGNAGGGGGRTRVERRTGTVNLVEAGAGGGGGGARGGGSNPSGAGGAGGANVGETGEGADVSTGGGGGTQSAGGTGGVGDTEQADDGGAGTGGNGATNDTPTGGAGAGGVPGGGEGGLRNGSDAGGGGGGAGYYGGGGGGHKNGNNGGSGGGGGSNFLSGTTESNVQGTGITGAGQGDGDYPADTGDGGITVFFQDGRDGDDGAVHIHWVPTGRSLDGMTLMTADFQQGTAAAENPGIFDTDENEEWGGITIAIRLNTAGVSGRIFSPTTKFNALTTTGVITLDGGAIVDGLTFNSDVIIAENTVDLTDVVIFGDLSITDGGTYNFRNVIITGAITNDDNTENVLINSFDNSFLSTSEPGTGISQVDIKNIVTVQVTVLDAVTVSPIQDVRVYLSVSAAGGSLPYQESVTITRSGSTATVTHAAHGLTTGFKVLIEGADQDEYNRIKVVTVTDENTYTYSVSGTPATPATGTITATGVVLDATTDAQGVVQSTTFNYSTDTAVTGNARKSDTTPLYKSGLVTGDVESTGLVTLVSLVRDD